LTELNSAASYFEPLTLELFKQHGTVTEACIETRVFALFFHSHDPSTPNQEGEIPK